MDQIENSGSRDSGIRNAVIAALVAGCLGWLGNAFVCAQTAVATNTPNLRDPAAVEEQNVCINRLTRMYVDGLPKDAVIWPRQQWGEFFLFAFTAGLAGTPKEQARRGFC